MLHILEHTIIDSLKVVPFLLLTFLLIELIEHKFSNKTKKIVEKSGKYGPVVGSLLGMIPQCGFSVAATNLYITRVISLGTLFAIYLSTSDEMLPILISNKIGVDYILIILLIKLVTGILFGFLIDSIFKNKFKNFNYDVCEDEQCDCNNGIFKSSIIHTLKITLFIIIASLIINVLFEYTNDNFLNKVFLKNSIFGPFIGSLIGLIPNCGSSVVITELFLSNTINLGTCIAGLLTGSGVAILVLFRSNKNLKENIFIISTLYLIGVLVGIMVEIIKIFF